VCRGVKEKSYFIFFDLAVISTRLPRKKKQKDDQSHEQGNPTVRSVQSSVCIAGGVFVGVGRRRLDVS
jgi:hypothetical protein